MPTHLLRELAIPGAERVLAVLPAFDLHRLERVLEIGLRKCSGADDAFDVTVVATYEDGRTRATVTMSFSGARLVRLPPIAGSFFLGELEIEDVSSDQLEGIRFVARDHGMTDFEVACFSMTIDAEAV